MRKIITVRGEIHPDQLGFCQFHEHVAMRRGEYTLQNKDLCIDDYEKSMGELEIYRSAGGNSIVEAQPVGCGRDAAWLRSFCLHTGVHIIASTGFHKLCFYPDYHWIHACTEEEVTNIFRHELTVGMYTDGDFHEKPEARCSARAGMIKTALDEEGLTERYKKLFRSAVSASRETGASIMVHVEKNVDPRPLQKYCMELGLSAKRLIFCHLDRACESEEMMREILRAGSWLEFDTIGRFKYHEDLFEIGLMKNLFDAGFEDQLLYSLDTTRGRLRSFNQSGVGLDYILRVFNGLMLAEGIDQTMIDKLSRKNPLHALTQ